MVGAGFSVGGGVNVAEGDGIGDEEFIEESPSEGGVVLLACASDDSVVGTGVPMGCGENVTEGDGANVERLAES